MNSAATVWSGCFGTNGEKNRTPGGLYTRARRTAVRPMSLPLRRSRLFLSARGHLQRLAAASPQYRLSVAAAVVPYRVAIRHPTTTVHTIVKVVTCRLRPAQPPPPLRCNLIYACTSPAPPGVDTTHATLSANAVRDLFAFAFDTRSTSVVICFSRVYCNVQFTRSVFSFIFLSEIR